MKTIVIKVGTSSLTKNSLRLCRKSMLEIVRQIALLHENSWRVVLVTSGSIAAGREILQQPKIDRSLPEKQMLSSIGQVHLMHIWKELFSIFSIPVGQLLLTRSDFIEREGYLNARNTLDALLDHRVIPIVNENDSVATREIQFGDNDNLAALVANLIAADLLLLLTDQEGFFTADPNRNPQAQFIEVVQKIDENIMKLAGDTTKKKGMGSGGMFTKIEAARLATQSGTLTVIASSAKPEIILDLISGKKVGTHFLAQTTYRESRKRWLLAEKTHGKIKIDEGASLKLQEGASLLSVGAQAVELEFERGSTIEITSLEGKVLAKGIVNYSSTDIKKICGRRSIEIESVLGYSYGPEVVHRDNMTLLR